MTKALQQMSMADLKDEMIRLYDGDADEIFYELMEMQLSRSAIKKTLIRYIERKQNS
jgi:hypothetical protein